VRVALADPAEGYTTGCTTGWCTTRPSCCGSQLHLWMELVTRAGPAYAHAWRCEKDRMRDEYEHGRSHAADDLMTVSDVSLLAAAEACLLFPWPSRRRVDARTWDRRFGPALRRRPAGGLALLAGSVGHAGHCRRRS